MGCAPSTPETQVSPEPVPDQQQNGSLPSEPSPRRKSKTPRKSPRRDGGLPEPRPPAKSKADIYNPDKLKEWYQRAITIKNYGTPNEFETLARYLTDGASKDLQKLRSIYVWITSQDCTAVDDSVQTDLNSPLGYLAALKRDHGSYADFFLRICLASDLPCVTIEGFAKGVGYQPGQAMTSDEFSATWNAVLVDNYWRLVDVHWGARFITGDDKQQNWQLIDSDTSAAVSTEQVLTYDSDDFFFLVDPDKMIFSHFPHDPQWQLLDDPIDLKTFEDQAFIKRHFLKLGLNIKSHPLAIIHSGDGQCDIQFTLPMKHYVTFAYKLFTVSGSNKAPSNATKLNQFVVQQTMNKIQSFKLSFPFTGKFLVEFFAVSEYEDKNDPDNGQFMNQICSYIVNCTKAKANCKPLPPTKGFKGFGPGIDVVRKKLVPLTHKSGVITTEDGQVEIKFKMEGGPMEFAHFLHNNNISDSVLQSYVVHRIVDDTLIITVSLPETGEYSLDLFGELVQEDNPSLPHLCSYLIQNTNSSPDPPHPFPNAGNGMFGACNKNLIAKHGLKFSPSDPFVICADGELSVDVGTKGLKGRILTTLEHQTSPSQFTPMNDNVFQERTKDKAKLSASLPKAGYYKLSVFVAPDDSSDAIPNVFNYLVYCPNDNTGMLRFPTAYADWNENCALYEPKQGLLPIAEEVNFSVTVPDATAVFVVNPDDHSDSHITRLQQHNDGTWNGLVDTGNASGDLQLAAQYGPNKEPQGLLGYTVLNEEQSAALRTADEGSAGEEQDLQDQEAMKKREKDLAARQKEDEQRRKAEEDAAEAARKSAEEEEARAARELEQAQQQASQVDDETKRLQAEQQLRRAKEEAEKKRIERIRKDLKAAMKKMNQEHIQECLKLFEDNDIPDIDGDYAEAQEIILYFETKKMLSKAIKSREIPKLQKALDSVKKSNRSIQKKLELEVSKAERILESLKHIQKLQHAIMKLDQKTIAEIKNYSSPPAEVHIVFRVTLFLLGTKLKETEAWNDVLVHIGKLGRESLKRRITTFKVTSVTTEMADKANRLLEPYSTASIRKVSSGAATFFVWSKGVIKEVYAKKEDDSSDSEEH